MKCVYPILFVTLSLFISGSYACEESTQLEKENREKHCLIKFREIDERLALRKVSLLAASKSKVVSQGIKDLAYYADQSVDELMECQADLLFTVVEVGSKESQSQLEAIHLAQVLRRMVSSNFNVSETDLIVTEMAAERYFGARKMP